MTTINLKDDLKNKIDKLKSDIYFNKKHQDTYLRLICKILSEAKHENLCKDNNLDYHLNIIQDLIYLLESKNIKLEDD